MFSEAPELSDEAIYESSGRTRARLPIASADSSVGLERRKRISRCEQSSNLLRRLDHEFERGRLRLVLDFDVLDGSEYRFAQIEVRIFLAEIVESVGQHIDLSTLSTSVCACESYSPM